MYDTIDVVLAEARAKAQNYPQYAYLLKQSGILHYHVEVATHLITYYGNEDDQCYIVAGSIVVPEELRIPHRFDEAGVKAALKANQEGQTDYMTFLQQIWRSGVTHYDAELQGRVCTYCGLAGESYSEQIPLEVVN